MRSLARRGLLAWAGSCLVEEALASCGCDEWFEAYGGERCYNDGDTMALKCEANNGADCGARLSSGEALGVGTFSLTLKAIPGSGAATTFYLSTNAEGMYQPDQGGWNEIDFEILGLQAAPDSTMIWTNLFTGTAEEHHEMIEVPFDVSADFHTYTIEITETKVKWLVDWKVYRTEDFSGWDDMKSAVQESRFKRFFSVWGKASYEPLGACQEFMDALGNLDENPGPFPLVAEFKMGTPSKPADVLTDDHENSDEGDEASPDEEAPAEEAPAEEAPAEEAPAEEAPAEEAPVEEGSAEEARAEEGAEGEAPPAKSSDVDLEVEFKQLCRDWGCVDAVDPAAQCQCYPGCKETGDCCGDFEDSCEAAGDEAGGVIRAFDAARGAAAHAAPAQPRLAVAAFAALATFALGSAVVATRWRRGGWRDDQEAAALLEAVEGDSAESM